MQTPLCIRLCGALALSLAALTGTPASAAITSNVTVSLLAPGGLQADATPISFVDVLGAGDGTKLSAGDGSNIGGFMLPAEQISFVGNSIHITIASGDVTAGGELITGLLGSGGVHARYDFSNITIAGQQIVGVSLSDKDNFADSGFSGVLSPASPGSYVHLLNAHQLTVDLDTLVFASRGGQSDAFLDLRIDLITQAVPEPATTALLLAGGLGLAWRVRRKQR